MELPPFHKIDDFVARRKMHHESGAMGLSSFVLVLSSKFVSEYPFLRCQGLSGFVAHRKMFHDFRYNGVVKFLSQLSTTQRPSDCSFLRWQGHHNFVARRKMYQIPGNIAIVEFSSLLVFSSNE